MVVGEIFRNSGLVREWKKIEEKKRRGCPVVGK